MTVQSRWVSFKNHSGYLAKGGPKIAQPVNATLHVDRAVYLTGQLEAGSWGTVQSYDGAGISGGIIHNIAVMPASMTQGDFWGLLQVVFSRAPAASAPVIDALSKVGWKVASDGHLRDAAGVLVSAKAIRTEISGAEAGNVPNSGPDSLRAQAWAERLSTLLMDSSTYSAQSDWAATWLANGNKGDELSVYTFFVKHALDSIIGLQVSALPPEVELAMDVYHAFSVNAPGTAKGVLSPVLARLKANNLSPVQFATALIRALGTDPYANWKDMPGDGGDRYDRTRLAVWARADLWDTTMAHSLMPRDL